MASATSTDTKTQILDVAEQMFAAQGFAGTTLRNIVSKAGVNLAAVHYHFGSKEELFRAVVARIAKSIVESQLQRLAQLETGDKPPTVEAILTVFLTPPLECTTSRGTLNLSRAQFMGRCRTEPEPIQSIARNEFSPSIHAFLDALQRALPDQSRAQLFWKLDLVVAAMIRVQTQAGQPHALLRGSSSEDVQRTISQLVGFLAPGMKNQSNLD